MQDGGDRANVQPFHSPGQRGTNFHKNTVHHRELPGLFRTAEPGNPRTLQGGTLEFLQPGSLPPHQQAAANMICLKNRATLTVIDL